MDEGARKTVLRLFTYGIHVAGARTAGEIGLMTVNFVSQCSFSPPMVMAAMEIESQTRSLVQASRCYALSVLATGQRELAGQLGRHRARAPGKLDGVEWEPGPVTGAPVLVDSLGWLELAVRGEIPAGDHVIYVSEVVNAGIRRAGAALTMAETGFRHAG